MTVHQNINIKFGFLKMWLLGMPGRGNTRQKFHRDGVIRLRQQEEILALNLQRRLSSASRGLVQYGPAVEQVSASRPTSTAVSARKC